jgi:hypothetical protein
MLAKFTLADAGTYRRDSLEADIQRALDAYSVAYQIEWR